MSYTKILNRRGTTAGWADSNPILAAGEIGLDIELGKIKIGNGSTAWNDLGYGLGSAYDVALNNGFVGTEEEWLASLVGPQGDPIITGMNWQGEWNPLTDYVNFDTVYYNGASWYASGDPTVGEEPTMSAEHWYPLAIQGATGPTGPTGATGPTGPSGGFSSAQDIVSLSTNTTLSVSHVGKLITNGAAITVTLPGSILTVGQQIDFLQTNINQITFAAGAGVIMLASKDGYLKTAALYSPVSVKCIATGVYVLVGDLGV